MDNLSKYTDSELLAILYQKSNIASDFEQGQGLPTCIESVLKELGMSYSVLAEKMEISRQAARKITNSEKSGKIRLKTMKRVAESIDCDFVYSFVPKKHKSLTHLLMDRALPFVQNPEVYRRREGRMSVYLNRIKKLFSSPTGLGKVWGQEKALRRKKYY